MKSCSLLVLLLLATSLHAQIVERPVNRRSQYQLRVKSDTIPISLPLWDDFSGSNYFVDTAFWTENEAVFVNPGIGKNPPTLNVATLDGWDARGNLYSQDPELTGAADSLVSRPILLNDVPQSLRNTVFLSFFYQFEGNGDKPNPTDSLVLQFRQADGTWKTVWPLDDNVIRQPNVFTQQFVQVTDAYFSDQFQFKFTTYGRLNGPFDTWNLDYVYLDKNRSENDGINYLDRAFREVPTSILSPFTAIPKEHFFEASSSFLDSTQASFTNLEANVQPVEFSVVVEEMYAGQHVEDLIRDSAFLALRYPFGNSILAAGHLDPSLLDDTADSLLLRTRFIMDTGDKHLIDSITASQDTVFTSIDLRVNDTTEVYTSLSDFYAYDDGTAEFGAGINQLNGRIAVQFAPIQPGILKGVDINFQNVGGVLDGTPVNIFVLRDLDRTRFSLIGTLNTSVITGSQINEFISYDFGKPIVALDTFYIGFEQASNDFIAVGLDKNTDNGDKVYYNITGDWIPNSDLSGSLMIRPVYTDELVNAVEPIRSQITVYPNPTTGMVQIEGKFERIALFSSQGTQLYPGVSGSRIDLSDYPPGVYVLRIHSARSWTNHRIVKLP